MKFALRGDKIVWLQIIDAIQLTMRMDVTSEEFWANDGPTDFIDRLAAVLLIPSYRIRIVDTYQGSVFVKTQISQKNELVGSTNSTGGKETIEELEYLRDLLIEKADDNSLDMGYPVMEIDMIVIDGSGDIESDENGNPISDDFITVVIEEN